MKTTARTMMVGIGLSIAALTMSPTTSTAHQNHQSSSNTGGPLVLALNEDQFAGKWKQFKGELKKKWGKLTDDDLLEAEGDYDKFLSVVQKSMAIRKSR